MRNLNNTTKIIEALCTLLYVVRLFAFIPLILICLCFVPMMYLLGISDPIGIWVKLNEGVVFDVKD
jgi:hypothetical protein